MRQEIKDTFELDEHGHPAGGLSTALGLRIDWHGGPLVDPVTGERGEPNGCFLETVILASIRRLEFYQEACGGKFRCRENAVALTNLETALLWLGKRTADREARGVEGTHVA